MSTWATGIVSLIRLIVCSILCVSTGCLLVMALLGNLELSDAQMAGTGVLFGYFFGKTAVLCTTRK